MRKFFQWLIGLFRSKKANQTIQPEKVVEQKPITIDKLKAEQMAEPKISKEELIKAGDPIDSEDKAAFEEFFEKINIFRDKCGIPMYPTSYYRSKSRQIRIYKDKAKKKEFPFTDGVYNESKVPLASKHMTGYACDFADSNKKLAEWVLKNIDWCKANGYYFENFGADIDTYKRNTKLDKTPTWLHIQIRPPKSGRVIFNP